MSTAFVYNNQNAFFTINILSTPTSVNSSTSSPNNQISITKDVISFSYTEEMSKLGSGSITFNDPNGYYGLNFRVGCQFQISFGYTLGGGQYSLKPSNLTSEKFTNEQQTRSFRVYSVNPHWDASAQGQTTFVMNFYELALWGTQSEIKGSPNLRVFNTGTKADVVKQCFAELGVDPAYTTIKFLRGDEPVTSDTSIRQDTGTFKFLSDKSLEWQTFFRLAYINDGKTIAGVFISPFDNLTANLPFASQVVGSQNLLLPPTFNYKNPKGDGSVDVISWSGENREGENGVGDNAIATLLNGTIVINRYQASAQKVVSYKFNQEKLQSDFDTSTDWLAYVSRWLGVNDFQTLLNAGYFTAIGASSVPQGYGFTFNIHLYGNPLITTPALVYLGDGFPPQVGPVKKQQYITTFDLAAQAASQTPNKFYIRKVTHTINSGGYFTDVEVADVYAFSLAGIVITSTNISN